MLSRIASRAAYTTSARRSAHPQFIRYISFKAARPRFASVAATTTTQGIPAAPPPGLFPYSFRPVPPPGVKLNVDPKAALPAVNFDHRQVAVAWDDTTSSRFHNIWLRDHCRCPKCFHPITKQRLVDTFEIPESIRPSQVIAKESGLEIVWRDSTPHKSVYPWTWLRQNSYDPIILNKSENEQPHPIAEPHEKVFWGASIHQDPPTVHYEEVISTDHGVYEWLDKVDRFGFCFVTGVPITPEDTEKLSRRIGNIRETQYGSFWDFTADLKHGDTAYTNIALKAHTDTTYFTDPCGLQLFHLLSHTQGSGGQTLLVDGFYVASLLSTLSPDVYHLLSTIPIPAHSAGSSAASPKSFSYLYHPKPKVGYPILNHDRTTGELIQVRYNNDDRSVMRHLEPGLVEPWYRAMMAWNRALSSPDSEYWVQLKPGTAVVVDNQRVLHGRSAFTGERRMCGAYINMDDFVSKLNVLRARFEPSEMAKEADGGVWDLAF